MTPEMRKVDDVVASLTSPGQPFELDTVEIDGVHYRNFAALPASLGHYCRLMRQHSEKDFAVYREERYTFGETWQHSEAFAAALVQHFGVGKGDRVVILSRNNPQWMMAFIAAVSVGAVVVPMNAWWTTEELDYGFGDCGARVVVADRERVERLAPIVERHGLRVVAIDDCSESGVEHTAFGTLLEAYAGAEMPEVDVTLDDHATIMYTSGSTGHPKGALSSHRGVLSALFSWVVLGQAIKLTAGESGGALLRRASSVWIKDAS